MFHPVDVLRSQSSSLSWWLLIAILVFAARYLIVVLSRGESKHSSAPIPSAVAITPRPILTASEAKFFRVLQAVVGRQYYIFPQLPLWTLIQARSDDQKTSAAFTNRINLKRIDLVLIDLLTLKPVMAIELDDRSHQRADRQQRDAFVESVLDRAGIPLVRIPASTAYDPQTIRKQLGLETRENMPA